MLYRHPVTRLRGTAAEDEYRNQSVDWSDPDELAMRVLLQQVGSTEDVVQQQRTETRWRMYAAPGSDVLATDRFRWGTRTLEVVSEPERPPAPFSLVAVLREVQQG